MPSCAIALCDNTHLSLKAITKKLTFHRFPVDKIVCSIWVSKCKRKDKINPKNAVICSNHFEETDFVIDRASEVLGMHYRRKLKTGTIPTKNLPLQQGPKKQRSIRKKTTFSE